MAPGILTGPLTSPLTPDTFTDFLQGVELRRTPAGEAYAVLCDHERTRTFPLRSSEFQSWLRLMLFRRLNTVPTQAQVADTVALLEAQAQLFGPVREVEIATLPDDHLLAAALRRLYEYSPTQDTCWSGPAPALLEVLQRFLPDQVSDTCTWARSQDALVFRLRHAGPALEAQGLQVFIRSGRGEMWEITIDNRHPHRKWGRTEPQVHDYYDGWA